MTDYGEYYEREDVPYRNRGSFKPFSVRPLRLLGSAKNEAIQDSEDELDSRGSFLPSFLYTDVVKSSNFQNSLEFSNMDQEFKEYVARLIPPSEDPIKNRTILSCLNQVADFFIHSVAPDSSWKCGETFVRAFGSYGLGLDSMRSDVDAVLIAPNFVTREMFFHRFLDLLVKQENVRDVCPVESTFVPVIKFMYYGVEIDLTFVRLAEIYVPDEDGLFSESILDGMDEKSKKSLNGWRVCQYLLDYVPDQDVFRTLLAFIKHWAVRRVIYSNLLGYLGGVSWAILAAYVCKKYSGASILKHVKEFFRDFYNWNWTRPMNINEYANPLAVFQRGSGEDYVMPIITPCSPYQISSYNITRTTLNTIRTEMRRALSLLESSLSGPQCWDAILEERDPFSEYETFLAVVVLAKSESDLRRWKGIVESRLRQFILALEAISGVKRVQIVPRAFGVKKLDEPGVGPEDLHSVWVVGFDHPKGLTEAGEAVKEFQDRVLNPLMAKEGMLTGQQAIFKGFKRTRLMEWLDR